MYSTTEHGMVAMTWSALFWREYVLNNFDVSRQLANEEKLCLLTTPSPSPTRARWLAARGETFAYKPPAHL